MSIITLLMSLWYFVWFMVSIKSPLDNFETTMYGFLSIVFLVMTIFIWRI